MPILDCKPEVSKLPIYEKEKEKYKTAVMSYVQLSKMRSKSLMFVTFTASVLSASSFVLYKTRTTILATAVLSSIAL